jgi:hypothetical protein
LSKPLSDVYWFLPVATVRGEVEKFVKVCEESKPSGAAVKTSISPDAAVVFDADFPLWDFFRVNYCTDSMKNRRRLWRISLQFREEWYKYRTEGWEKKDEERISRDSDNGSEYDWTDEDSS